MELRQLESPLSKEVETGEDSGEGGDKIHRRKVEKSGCTHVATCLPLGIWGNGEDSWAGIRC